MLGHPYAPVKRGKKRQFPTNRYAPEMSELLLDEQVERFDAERDADYDHSRQIDDEVLKSCCHNIPPPYLYHILWKYEVLISE